MLVPEHMIEGAVETILVDLLIAKLKQIGKRCATVPIFGNVQLARWLAEPRHHEHGCHFRPGNALLSNGQQLLWHPLVLREPSCGSRPSRGRWPRSKGRDAPRMLMK